MTKADTESGWRKRCDRTSFSERFILLTWFGTTVSWKSYSFIHASLVEVLIVFVWRIFSRFSSISFSLITLLSLFHSQNTSHSTKISDTFDKDPLHSRKLPKTPQKSYPFENLILFYQTVTCISFSNSPHFFFNRRSLILYIGDSRL